MLIVLVSVLGPAPASGQDPAFSLEASYFVERFGSESDVRGTTIVGVLAGDLSGQVDLGNLRAFVARELSDQQLCVRMITQDGRYEASARFRTKSGANGLGLLKTNSDHGSELRSYSSAEFSVRAEFKESCESPHDGVLTIAALKERKRRRGGGPEPEVRPSTLRVLVNALDADAQAAIVAPGQEPSWTKCENAGPGAQVAFDRVCSVPLPKGTAARAVLWVQVEGWTGAKDDYRTPVVLPAP